MHWTWALDTGPSKKSSSFRMGREKNGTNIQTRGVIGRLGPNEVGIVVSDICDAESTRGGVRIGRRGATAKNLAKMGGVIFKSALG